MRTNGSGGIERVKMFKLLYLKLKNRILGSLMGGNQYGWRKKKLDLLGDMSPIKGGVHPPPAKKIIHFFRQK